ncbi:magnesium transporter MRS2-F-like isoform X2 [Panicum virgatum]|uniref:magnesium transporter MRS2-F-like isoform X2 n=1 Tax=Panicum virgatum TaxID=38727 RepID=UPI0019D55A65|nr:magnesium transporter MRS2-F-like isoform X2 [Panicum virgatum]
MEATDVGGPAEILDLDGLDLHIKNRLVALSGRVQKVKDGLEHLLDNGRKKIVTMRQTLDEKVFPMLSLILKSWEMLVEAYFVQIDGTLNKLMANVLTHPLLGDE